MTKKEVEEILKTVLDPELGIDMVSLGLIYKIEVIKGDIYILMTLTTVGCPLGSWFVEQVKQAVTVGLKIDEENVIVEITFDPPWSQEAMSDEAKEKLGLL
jgi:metal-sulfur cluster biosynthetic enzyme